MDYAPESSVEYRLLTECQQDFPLCITPFAEVAERFGVGETVLLSRIATLRREGRISRVGAVFAPKRIGASTLVALSVPADLLAETMRAVNRFPEVNQNYLRSHARNFWFVVTAGSDSRLQSALDAIGKAVRLPLLLLPLKNDYSEWFSSGSASFVSREDTLELSSPVPHVLDEIGRRLVMALQEGLPLFMRPYSVLANRVGCNEAEVIERIRNWCSEGLIKRFGVVLRSPGTASGVSALLVLDVDDSKVAGVGRALAAEPGVSACQERCRSGPEWAFNLYCMVHAASREALVARVESLRLGLGILPCAFDILFSLGCEERYSGQVA